MEERPGGAERLGGDRFGGLLERWSMIELWVGLSLVAIGFLAVAVGWWKAADTADMRIQIQALISGGLGGLAMVLAGAGLIGAQATSTGFRRLEHQLDRVADAVLELAVAEAQPYAAHSAAGGAESELDTVYASHASYHRASCDLAAGREGLRPITIGQAQKEELRPCGVCFAAKGVLA